MSIVKNLLNHLKEKNVLFDYVFEENRIGIKQSENSDFCFIDFNQEEKVAHTFVRALTCSSAKFNDDGELFRTVNFNFFPCSDDIENSDEELGLQILNAVDKNVFKR